MNEKKKKNENLYLENLVLILLSFQFPLTLIVIKYN